MTYVHKRSSGLTLLIIGAGLSVIEAFCYVANIGFIYHYFWISPFLNGLISSILSLAGFIMFNKEFSGSLYFPRGQPPVTPSITAIQQPTAMVCPHCGHVITENFSFCPYCGKKLVWG
jgi:DNA-directed RNA polymerase subunit RPC12/RpoP